jgi:hypothetical protein
MLYKQTELFTPGISLPYTWSMQAQYFVIFNKLYPDNDNSPRVTDLSQFQ